MVLRHRASSKTRERFVCIVGCAALIAMGFTPIALLLGGAGITQPVAPPAPASRVVAVTSAYTAQPGDTVVCDPSGGAFTVTLPPTGNGVNRGRGVLVVNGSGSANTVTIAAQGSGVTVDGAASIARGLPWGSTWVVSNGDDWFSAANSGYSPILIPFSAQTISPTDAQTVYVGLSGTAPNTAADVSRVYIPRDGVITQAAVYVGTASVAGSNEAWSCYVRYDNTTDTLIETVSSSSASRLFDSTSLSIAVQAGHYVELKFVNPTWATNPTNVRTSGWLLLQ